MDSFDKEQIAQPDQDEDDGIDRSFRRIRDYGGIENNLRLRVEEREKRTGKTLTTEDLP
jgi:hypothetical protein